MRENQQIEERFNTIIKEKVMKITLMNGYTNEVYKIQTDKRKYIFKFIKSCFKNNPFTKNEQFTKKLINYQQIYQDDEIEIEDFIENITTYDKHFKDLFSLNMLFTLSQFNKIDKKFDYINMKKIFMQHEQQIYQQIHQNINDLTQQQQIKMKNYLNQVDKIWQNILKNEQKQELVLSHNDCYHNNFLLSVENKQQKYVLIDFECSGYNPMGMDIFNIINEQLVDYGKKMEEDQKIDFSQMPSEKELLEIIKYYLFCYEYGEQYKQYDHNQQLID